MSKASEQLDLAFTEFRASWSYFFREVRRLAAYRCLQLIFYLTPKSDYRTFRAMADLAATMAQPQEPKWEEQKAAIRVARSAREGE